MESVETPSHLTPRPRRTRGLVQEIVEGLEADIRDGHINRATNCRLRPKSWAALMSAARWCGRPSRSCKPQKWWKPATALALLRCRPPDTSNFKIASEDFATVSDVIAVLELRIGLEAEAAGLAAQRRTEANLTALTAALEAFQNSINQDSDAVPPDFQFHMEVARATQNQHFTDLMTYLGAMIIPRTRVNTPNSAPEGRYHYLQRVHAEHESILNAIRNQDVDAARAAMRTHLGNSRERLRKIQTQPTDRPT